MDRLAGRTRDETATAVARYTVDRLAGFSDHSVLLAHGDAFPDALAAGVAGGVLGAPLLLTVTPDAVGEACAFDSSCGRMITYPDGSTAEESCSWRYEGVGC